LDRYWLLTWTTYGTWLPGDDRGSVTRVRDGLPADGPRVERDVRGTPYVAHAPGLVRASRAAMKGPPVELDLERALATAEDLSGTAEFRGWELLAGAVMATHVHVVVGVADDPDRAKLLQIFKSYASRALSSRWPRPKRGTWWTESGSRRKLADDEAVAAAVRYVTNQPNCLARCRAVIRGTRGTIVPRSPASD
jgi:REP element-mobilizing transposase RayT